MYLFIYLYAVRYYIIYRQIDQISNQITQSELRNFAKVLKSQKYKMDLFLDNNSEMQYCKALQYHVKHHRSDSVT